MAKPVSLAIIGLGNMGLPIAKTIIAEQVISPKSLTLINRDLGKLKKIKKLAPQIQIFSSVIGMSQSDFIILAVKPQDFVELSVELKKKVSRETVVLSVMAGISIAKIKKILGVKKVVRLMPNLAIEFKQAVLGCFYDSSVSLKEKKLIKKIFSKQGLFLELSEEKKINQITALAGSGPAYVAFLMMALEEAAKKFGFSKEISEQIVWQTFAGTIEFIKSQKITPSQLIAKVKSKGGTTEAALNVFEAKKINHSLQLAFQAALKRSNELSK